MAEYILRLDDAAFHANWEKWNRIECLLDAYAIRPLVGVIPDCKDPMINSFDSNSNFWDRVYLWKEKGWTIAMHGFDHVYGSENGLKGFNPVHRKSEFAGISFAEQRRKIRDGVQIFREHGINPQVFFPPSHTMDHNTINALKQESAIRIISDTIANAPYHKWGMTFVPQQSGQARKLPFKLTTFCYHPNKMIDDEFSRLETFLKKEGSHFISFPIEECYRKKTVYDWLLEKMYFYIRGIRKG